MNKILAINGSASPVSSNLRLIHTFAELSAGRATIDIIEDLKPLPPFQPELSADDPPESIVAFRSRIEKADGILICTPEYVFSIPSCLKNALEWCVATTIFDQKPTAIITASAHGAKGHEELQLILQTLGAALTEETKLLISGIRGKFSDDGTLKDGSIQKKLEQLTVSFLNSMQA
jgi:chromate reductase, NAD(P)H dehydrogenase (quinone)